MKMELFRGLYSVVVLIVICFISSPLYSSSNHHRNETITIDKDDYGSTSPRGRSRSRTIDGSPRTERRSFSDVSSTLSKSTDELPGIVPQTTGGAHHIKRTVSYHAKTKSSLPSKISEVNRTASYNTKSNILLSSNNIEVHNNELLNVNILKMNEDAFKTYLKMNRENAVAKIKDVLATGNGLDDLIKRPGWGVKLSCDSSVALQVLRGSNFFNDTNQQDKKNFGQVISAALSDEKNIEILLSNPYVSAAMLVDHFPSDNASRIDETLKKLVNNVFAKDYDRKNISDLAPYWKGYTILAKRGIQDVGVYNSSPIELLEKYLKYYSNIPMGFEAITSAFDKGDLSNLCYLKGITSLYSSPTHGLEWLREAERLDNLKSRKALGAYYWRLGKYEQAQTYLSNLPGDGHILAAITEQIEGNEAAIKAYMKASVSAQTHDILSQPLATLRLLQLKKELKKEHVRINCVASSLESYLEKIAACKIDDSNKVKTLEAALIAVHINQFSKAKLWIESSDNLTISEDDLPLVYEQHLWVAYIHSILGNDWEGWSVADDIKTQHFEAAKAHLDIVKGWAAKTKEYDIELQNLYLRPLGLPSFSLKTLSQTGTEQIQRELVAYYRQIQSFDRKG